MEIQIFLISIFYLNNENTFKNQLRTLVKCRHFHIAMKVMKVMIQESWLNSSFNRFKTFLKNNDKVSYLQVKV